MDTFGGAQAFVGVRRFADFEANLEISKNVLSSGRRIPRLRVFDNEGRPLAAAISRWPRGRGRADGRAPASVHLKPAETTLPNISRLQLDHLQFDQVVYSFLTWIFRFAEHPLLGPPGRRRLLGARRRCALLRNLARLRLGRLSSGIVELPVNVLASFPELIHALSQAPRQVRQLLRPEEDKNDEEYDKKIRTTQIPNP